MLTRLNTLYVLTQGTYLSKEGECVQLRTDAGKKLLPIHLLGGGIVTFGNVLITPYLMGHCAANAIPITCLTEHGAFLARIQGDPTGNVFLRRRQHTASLNPTDAARLAARFLLAKIANTRAILRRGARERPQAAQDLNAAADQLTLILTRIQTTPPPDLDTLRGLEGDAAARAFAVYRHLLAPSGLPFPGRVRRPPTDPANALLSFLYTLLAHDCATALIAAGLDPQIGLLHRDRPGRPSLALDLMEELRPLLADRLAIALLNRRQITAKDFTVTPTHAHRLTDDARKTVLTAWQERKKTPITHPYDKETQPLGLIPFTQATLLARHLRGDLEDYPPFIWR